MEKVMYPKTGVALNQLVADLSQLYLIVHQTHWYMRGESFYKMHPKMDEFMDQLSEQIDSLAERLIEIGGSPLSTFKEYLEVTKLKERKGKWGVSIENLVKELVKDYKTLSQELKNAIKISGDEEDLSTQDMIIGINTETDKNIWMLQAFLGKSPLEN